MDNFDDWIDRLKKQLIELEKGGNTLVYKKIQEWKEKEGIKPILDIQVLRLHIIMLQTSGDPSNPREQLLGEIWNTLLDRSFEAKLLDYELNFKK